MSDQPQLISQGPQLMNHCQMLNQQPPQVMMNPPVSSQLMGQPQILSHGQGGMYGPSSQATMVNRNYMPWQPQKDPNPNKKFYRYKTGFGRGNWKGKKPNDMRKESWKRSNQQLLNSAISGGGGYQPPTLNELQSQNRLKARKFYPKKFTNRFAPYAPRNTSSFIMRAKKSGGIASMVSPVPVTPAVLPTPRFSPSREVLVDMAKEEWGVDGYGSMKGLIRLRNEADNRDNEEEDEEEDENEEENNASSGESDVEEEKNNVLSRLDHEMSRFEMVYPNYGMDYSNVLENRVDDQDSHIAQLEEENLLLKDRLFLMERELGELRRRMQSLERQNQQVEYVNEEVVEKSSENESEEASGCRGMGDESNEVMEYVDARKFEHNGDSNVVAAPDK